MAAGGRLKKKGRLKRTALGAMEQQNLVSDCC